MFVVGAALRGEGGKGICPLAASGPSKHTAAAHNAPDIFRRNCFVMNSAAVLAQDRIGFNSYFIFLGGTDPWSARQFSRQVLWGAHAPVATLQHLFNLQAHFPSVKESGACASSRPSNSCSSGEHLLTVRMRSHPPWDGSTLCVLSSRKELPLP